MNKDSKGPNVKEVAAAAGVAVPTAYEALRGEGRLREETRQRVLDAAAKLGYRPNRAAQNMRRGRHRAIGLLLHRWTEFPKSSLFAFVNEARKRDLFMLLEYYEEEQVTPRLLREDCIDALFVFERHTAAIEEQFKQVGLHVIRINTDDRYGAGCITYDESTGAYKAANLLKQAGRQHPVLVLPQRQEATELHYSTAERQYFFNEAAQQMGLDAPRIIRMPISPDHVVEAFAEAFDSNPIDSILIYADAMAGMVYHALRMLGKHIPGDVAVLAYNNTFKSKEQIPNVTGLGIEPEDLAINAFDMAELAVTSGRLPDPRKLTQHLYERESTPKTES